MRPHAIVFARAVAWSACAAALFIVAAATADRLFALAGGLFAAVGDAPLLQSPHAPAGLRYADRVALPEGGARWFYEATRGDGAHELRTVLLGD